MRFFVSTPLLLIVAFELISCVQSDRQVNESATTDTTLTKRSTTTNENEFPAIVRDIHSDSLLATDGTLSRINKLLKHGTQIRQEEFGGGDCDGKFKQLRFEKDTLTVVKYDCGDYGFGNTEFITKGDSLKFVREYRIEWFVDSIGGKFIVNESIYHFAGPASIKRIRTKFIQNLKDFRVSNIGVEERPIDGQEEYDAFKKELKYLHLRKVE